MSRSVRKEFRVSKFTTNKRTREFLKIEKYRCLNLRKIKTKKNKQRHENTRRGVGESLGAQDLSNWSFTKDDKEWLSESG